MDCIDFDIIAIWWNYDDLQRIEMFCGRILTAATLVVAAQAGAFERTEARADCADYRPERQALWGDLHVHTSYSLDANMFDTRATPADTYRFARGERMGFQPYEDGRATRHWQLARPLDFAAATDHVEMLADVHICRTKGLKGYYSPMCLIVRHFPSLKLLVLWSKLSNPGGQRPKFCGEDGEYCDRITREGPWPKILAANEAAYDRSSKCEFSSFVAYEWTGGNLENLHRNVIYRNAKAPKQPLGFYRVRDQDEFLKRLDGQCPGCEAIVIPHNSNLSMGKQLYNPSLNPFTPEQARQRRKMERLFELFQHKGSSECWSGPGADEQCAFEFLPFANFVARFNPSENVPIEPTFGFARQVLGYGLMYAETLGANPHRFGFIGSTDTHVGAAGMVAESVDYLGHNEARETKRYKFTDLIELNPGGLAAVWAEENSRDSIFAAMHRRETYSTSGPRIELRFFAGWDYPDDACESAALPEIGYAGGVPMGGELDARGRRAPQFIVEALRDVVGVDGEAGTPLQRVQIIKQALNAKGEIEEKVYEVAGDADNGADVDLASCRRSGGGFDRLCRVWRDPDHDPRQRAYYYARALENPSCRWSQKVCAANGVDCARPETIGKGLEACCVAEHRPVIQERAVSSPIWYLPEGKSN